MTYMLALRAFSFQVGNISLDATFFMYSIKGTVTFSTDVSSGRPKCTVIVSGMYGLLNKIIPPLIYKLGSLSAMFITFLSVVYDGKGIIFIRCMEVTPENIGTVLFTI